MDSTYGGNAGESQAATRQRLAEMSQLREVTREVTWEHQMAMRRHMAEMGQRLEAMLQAVLQVVLRPVETRLLRVASHPQEMRPLPYHLGKVARHHPVVPVGINHKATLVQALDQGFRMEPLQLLVKGLVKPAQREEDLHQTMQLLATLKDLQAHKVKAAVAVKVQA